MRSTVVGTESRFVQHHPCLCAHLKQSWEHIALAPTILAERSIPLVTAFITWCSASESTLGTHLRAVETGTSLRQTIACFFLRHQYRKTTCMLLHDVAESHILVIHMPFHRQHISSVLIGEIHGLLRSLHTDVLLLGIPQFITLFHGLSIRHLSNLQPFGKIGC